MFERLLPIYCKCNARSSCKIIRLDFFPSEVGLLLLLTNYSSREAEMKCSPLRQGRRADEGPFKWCKHIQSLAVWPGGLWRGRWWLRVSRPFGTEADALAQCADGWVARWLTLKQGCIYLTFPFNYSFFAIVTAHSSFSSEFEWFRDCQHSPGLLFTYPENIKLVKRDFRSLWLAHWPFVTRALERERETALKLSFILKNTNIFSSGSTLKIKQQENLKYAAF